MAMVCALLGFSALAGSSIAHAAEVTACTGHHPALIRAAGPASLVSTRAAPHRPVTLALRTYVGRAITLRTDTKHDYAKALIGKLDSFIAQATAELSGVLDLSAQRVGVTIVVFATQRRYQAHARKHAPALVNNGGYYDGSKRTVVTYRFNNSMQLYFHELVHSLMGEYFGDHHFSRYTRRHWPIWFDEGMSEYLGSYEVEGVGIRIPALNKGKLAYLANALEHDTFIDLQTLLRAPAKRFSGASMNIFYAESWGLVDFLVNHPVYRSQLPLFFRKVRGGQDGLSAFAACFGSDLRSFEKVWRAYIRRKIRAPDKSSGWLFNRHSIDDWTVHEGGQWRVMRGQIFGTGDRNYNYLIKNEVPMRDFSFELDILIEKGMAGLILGNNYHGEYPYYYLIDVARDAVTLRRSYTATRIKDIKAAFADVPLRRWVRLKVTVIDSEILVRIDGKKVFSVHSDRQSFSLFGLYLYHARARFKNLRIRTEKREMPGWAHLSPGARPLVRPAGAATLAPSPQVKGKTPALSPSARLRRAPAL